MTNKNLRALLKRMYACPELIVWVGERNLAAAWGECERADWMLWLCGRMAGKAGWPTKQQVVLAACACARLALRFVPAGEPRPLAAIEAAEAWANGIGPAWAARAAAWAAAEAAEAAEHKTMTAVLRQMLTISGGPM